MQIPLHAPDEHPLHPAKTLQTTVLPARSFAIFFRRQSIVRIDRCIKYFERRATLSRCIDRIYRICLSLWEGHSETRRSWWSISGVVVRVCINNDTFDKPMTTWFANTENYSFRKHQRNRWQNVTAGQARDSRPTFSNYRNGHLIPITIKSYDQFLVQFGYGQLSNDASQTTD